LLPGQPAQRPQFVAPDGMRAWCALLGPADGKGGVVEVDLVPAQIDQFRHSEAVPVGQQDHGGIAVAVSIIFGGARQALDFGIGQIFPSAQFSIRAAQRRGNCSIFSGRRCQFELGIRHVIPRSYLINCSKNSPFTNSRQELRRGAPPKGMTMAFTFDTLERWPAREFVMHELVTKADLALAVDNLKLELTVRIGGIWAAGIAVLAVLQGCFH
jgi:hypothetical protein